MEFEGLTSRLTGIFQKLRGKGKLSSKDIDDALREVRLSLLEADVNFKVVREFVSDLKERCVEAEIEKSLTPAQQVIKMVHEELVSLLGGKTYPLALRGEPPLAIALFGLQGSGKTTAAGKLAYLLRKQGRKILLVSCDVYRPGAQKQLEIVAQRAGAGFFTMDLGTDPRVIAKKGLERAKDLAYDILIIDTAGRTQIDEGMMDEAEGIYDAVSPVESLLVLDAMTGQEACRVAKTFDERLGITGMILSKLDSDARGGAALSITKVTGKPIKFASLGEKQEDFQVFHPDRMASRILGMGDVLTLIEKAQESFDKDVAQKMEQRLRRNEFTLEDFLEQMQEVQKMGSLGDILKMIPGASRMNVNAEVDQKQWKRLEAIISSMTPDERRKPEMLDGSRKRRVAKGSGTSVQEVNRLLKQFSQTKKMVSQMSTFEKMMGRMRF